MLFALFVIMATLYFIVSILVRWCNIPRGTKSVLFGAHQFLIHPLVLALAWTKLYGFPKDWRLWACFFVHDLGYIGKASMDDEDGETHPELGAAIMRRIAGESWGEFSLLHSRYYAKRLGKPTSRLAVADKLAIALTPAWLYIPLVRLTGEIKEYREQAKCRAKTSDKLTEEEKRQMIEGSDWDWYRGLRSYMRRYVEEHKDGKADTWTKARYEGQDREGI